MRDENSREDADERGEPARRVAELHAELARREEQVQRLEAMVELQRSTIARMQGSVAWQVATRLRYARDRVLAASPLLVRSWSAFGPTVKQLVRRYVPGVSPVPAQRRGYREWVARHELSPAQVAALREQAAARATLPVFSVLVPVHEIDERLLARCLASVREQLWGGWQLCAVDDGSRAPHVWPMLEAAAREEPRIRVARLTEAGGIVAATQRALELASGDFVAFLDHDDELAPEALLAVAARLARDPDLELLYSDEDKLDATGERVEPFFKPEWSPDLLLSMNYLGHLVAVRTALLREVGGLRAGFDGSQDYDLLLRLTERTSRIGHVPRVLYHWRKVAGSEASERGAKHYAQDAAIRSVEDALARRGIDGKIESPHPGLFHVRYRVRGEPLVSIVMPTRDNVAVLRACVESLERSTTWRRWELLVVDNGSTDPKARAYLQELALRHRVLRDDRAFNWSALNNAAVREARGEHLLFMNNDMEVIAPDWMQAMLEHSQRPEVGAVGARLLYPDRRVQHAGVVLGIGSAAGHAFKYLPDEAPGYAWLGHVVRDVSAVTGACMMVPRERFREVGGFEEGMPVAYNDIDFCLKLRRAGYLVVYTPHAKLYHHESATRRYLHPAEDEVLLKVRWRDELLHDPYYSPHLTREREDYSLAP